MSRKYTVKDFDNPLIFKKDNNAKETNPKQAIGSNKIPMHLWPNTATVYGAVAMLEGLTKYGRSNYRKAGVKISTYYDALRRHIDSYFEGEDIDPDSGLPHLAKALACVAILIDATVTNKITDDRMYYDIIDGYKQAIKEMTPHVKRLKELYKDKNPKHWTIKDKQIKYTKIKRNNVKRVRIFSDDCI